MRQSYSLEPKAETKKSQWDRKRPEGISHNGTQSRLICNSNTAIDRQKHCTTLQKVHVTPSTHTTLHSQPTQHCARLHSAIYQSDFLPHHLCIVLLKYCLQLHSNHQSHEEWQHRQSFNQLEVFPAHSHAYSRCLAVKMRSIHHVRPDGYPLKGQTLLLRNAQMSRRRPNRWRTMPCPTACRTQTAFDTQTKNPQR
jgi:hypothetical protein